MADHWTLAEVFGRRAAAHPGRPVAIAGGRAVTYGQLHARSSAMAAARSRSSTS